MKTNPPKPRLVFLKKNNSFKGFTLIEILVVIAIMGVLAALFFSISQQMRTKASMAQSVSNFRQIGTIFSIFAADNGRLPGPFTTGQRNLYYRQFGQSIGTVLWSYMDLPAPGNDWRPVPLLTVPALKSWPYNRGHPYPAAYAVNHGVKLPDATIKYPFSQHGSSAPPMRLLELSGLEPGLSKIWALWDQGGEGDPNAKFAKETPAPIYGKVRTVLFFDGHVESLPVDQRPEYSHP
jgi:prepilin-type N-terminal cleavage/methylation domain-containing protein/prepilin-type processing-associated H-X9-DG protein